MKYRIKDVIIFLLIILMICSCNTNNKNNADEIKKEIEKTDIINNNDIPDGVKDWEIKLHDDETNLSIDNIEIVAPTKQNVLLLNR